MSPHTLPADSPAASVLHRIPPFPMALIQILQTCSAEEPSATEIASSVAMEEVLAAKVVRAANGAHLGAAHTVNNVSDAVTRLGASAIRGMASAYFLGNTFSGAYAHPILSREAMWRHNLAVAAASAGAAGPGPERANAYFAGLMHDVGKMVFAAELGGTYAECVAEAMISGQDLMRVEVERFGIDHAEMGAEAAKQWRFVPEIVEAIMRHHQVLGAGLLPSLASHVLVGNQVANDTGFSSVPNDTSQNASAAPNMAASIGAGIMSRARWALTNEMPRIEAILHAIGDD